MKYEIFKNTKMYMEVVIVTPALAQYWLEQADIAVKAGAFKNRKLLMGKIKSYAFDMQEKNWKLTHQGIAFDKQGHLRDGFHTLNSILASNETIAVPVTWNVDPEAIAGVDRGTPRSTAAQATIIGIEHVTNSIAANARRMMRYKLPGWDNSRPLTDAALLQHIQKYIVQLRDVEQWMTTAPRGIRIAPVSGAMSRIHASTGRVKDVKNACEVLCTGFQDIGELNTRPLIVLQRFLQNSVGRSSSGGGSGGNVEAYSKTEVAMMHYLNETSLPERMGKPFLRAERNCKELFPLPEDEK